MHCLRKLSIAYGCVFLLNQVIECNVIVVLSKNLDLCYFMKRQRWDNYQDTVVVLFFMLMVQL